MAPAPPARPGNLSVEEASSHRGFRIPSTALVVAGAALLIAVVVAVASDGNAPSAGPSVVVDQALAAAFFGSFTLLLVLGTWMWILRLRSRQPGVHRTRRPRAPWWQRALTWLLFLLLFAAVSSWAGNRSEKGPVGSATSITTAPSSGGGDGGGGEVLPVAVVLAALVLIVSVAVVLAWARHRLIGTPVATARAEDAADGLPVEGLQGALASSAVDLEAIDDPRRAVIAAYVRMQTELAAVGTERRSTETELEFLTRVLTRMGGDGQPARSLTELFAQARYSDHQIDETMRAEALSAVRRLQSRLTAAAP